MMLEHIVLKRTLPGVALGHQVLEGMQNWRLPKIDLLVREVIQNCSDAADQVDGNEYYQVDFQTGYFDGHEFIRMLDGFDNEAIQSLSQPESVYLEIRDVGTIGLTGPVKLPEEELHDHGNYYKLVYEVASSHDLKDVYFGGSWGYGKGAYYCVGAGFVVYYSRIKEDGVYKSRLIITFIEDERQENTLLRHHADGVNSAGRAWWGKCIDGEIVLPIDDNDEIQQLLSIFNIEPFKDDETGTSVIIPYIDYLEFMNSIVSDEMDGARDIRQRCPWTYTDISGFSKYLELSIQRWYAPIVNNYDLYELINKKWLYVTVNGKAIDYDSMYPFFQLIQRLYTAALAKTVSGTERDTSWSVYYKNFVFPISINKYIDNSHGNTEVGYLALAKIPKQSVNIGEQAGLNPYLLIGCYEEGENERVSGKKSAPVVMYVRRLGMIIDYSYNDEWVHGIPPLEDEDDYLFAFFVPYLGDSKRLRNDLSVGEYAGRTLEEYLRSCEASDHEGWVDRHGMKVVSSIQKRVISRIKKTVQNDLVPGYSTNSDRIGTVLSKMLSISKTPKGKTIPHGGESRTGGVSLSKRVVFTSEIVEYNASHQDISFSLVSKKGSKIISIIPILLSDGGKMKSYEWERDIGSCFPVHFVSVSLSRLAFSSEQNKKDVFLTSDCTEGFMDDIKCTLRREKYKTNSKIEFETVQLVRFDIEFKEPLTDDVSFLGTLRICTKDNEYEYDLVASEGDRE